MSEVRRHTHPSRSTSMAGSGPTAAPSPSAAAPPRAPRTAIVL